MLKNFHEKKITLAEMVQKVKRFMYDSYEDKKYFDASYNVLRNKLGIENQQLLDFMEHQVECNKN